MKKFFLTVTLFFYSLTPFAEITIIQEINDLLIDKINGIVLLISTLFTSIGAFITWVLTRKYEQKKVVSLTKKETKINNVEGDTALINQLDLLLKKVADMSEAMLKVQEQISELSEREYSYKAAFHRLTLLCDEVCTDAEFCKMKIKKVLTDLKLEQDEIGSSRENS